MKMRVERMFPHMMTNQERMQLRYSVYKKFKAELECERCGFKHPDALDFHHRNSKEKKFNVSECNLGRWGLHQAILEMDKCDVLCANCHRIEHASGT